MAIVAVAATSTAATTAPTIHPPDSYTPFSKLPTEIRLAIYELAFEDELDTIIDDSGYYNFGKSRLKYRAALALVHVNKSIRARAKCYQSF